MIKSPRCGNTYKNFVRKRKSRDMTDTDRKQKISKLHEALIEYRMLIIVVLVLVLIAIGSNMKSQYEMDYSSMQNKTYDEMSAGEQQVFKDELEWELENADE